MLKDSFCIHQLFQLHTEGDNQLQKLRDDVTVTPEDLLSMPSVSVATSHHRCLIVTTFMNAAEA